MIKNIIFDFGGVILKHKSTIMEEFVSKMFNIPIDDALQIWTRYKTDILTGKLSSVELLNKIKEKVKSDKSSLELLNLWKELYKDEAKNVDRKLLDLIEKLKTKYRVYLFTDTIDIHDEYNRTRHIYDKFHLVFKSFEEKLRKPDSASFENILRKIHAKPEECLMIDDLQENVNKARDLGMETILFKNLGQLTVELEQLNLYKAE